METYDNVVTLLSIAGFFLAPAAGIIYLIKKKTARHLWIVGCIMLFFLFTAVRHLVFSIAYDDPADPNYAAYKDWTLGRLIFSDFYWLVIWAGIGIMNYLVFVKKNKLARWILIFCAAMLFLLLAVSSVGSI